MQPLPSINFYSYGHFYDLAKIYVKATFPVPTVCRKAESIF